MVGQTRYNKDEDRFDSNLFSIMEDFSKLKNKYWKTRTTRSENLRSLLFLLKLQLLSDKIRIFSINQ